jgi:hypothetical protein
MEAMNYQLKKDAVWLVTGCSSGFVYASNTAKQLLIKIPVIDGNAGKPEVVKREIGLDDFDFDSSGNLYGATHVYNSLVKGAPDGKVTIIGEIDQGMAGSTAVAVRTISGQSELFVTTNGGMSMPPEGGIQSGKVINVKLSK